MWFFETTKTKFYKGLSGLLLKVLLVENALIIGALVGVYEFRYGDDRKSQRKRTNYNREES